MTANDIIIVFKKVLLTAWLLKIVKKFLSSMFSCCQFVNCLDDLGRMGNVNEFNIGIGSGRLVEYWSIIKKCLKISPAFFGNILNLVKSGNANFFIQNCVNVYVNYPSIGNNTDIEIPVDDVEPDITKNKNQEKNINDKYPSLTE